jgi:hypothetical protein
VPEEFDEDLVAPSGLLDFGAQRDFGVWTALRDVQSQAAQDGEDKRFCHAAVAMQRIGPSPRSL